MDDFYPISVLSQFSMKKLKNLNRYLRLYKDDNDGSLEIL